MAWWLVLYHQTDYEAVLDGLIEQIKLQISGTSDAKVGGGG